MNQDKNKIFKKIRWFSFYLIKWTFFFLVIPGVFVSALFCPYLVPFIYCDVCPVYFCPMKVFRIPFLVISFIYVILSKKRYYTFCPVGTFQDILSEINKKTIKRVKLLTPVQRNMLKVVRYIMLSIAVILIFLFRDPRYMDPYHTFSISGLFYENIYYYLRELILLVILIASIFIPRFWCKICPFGALISVIYGISKKIKKFMKINEINK